MGFGWIIGIAFMVGIIWLLSKGSGADSKSDTKATRTALDILNERFARGEITNEEYQEKRNTIA